MSILAQFGLDGKCAIVTGGAGGLGAPIAQALAEAGAHVAVIDVSESVRAVADELASRGLAVSAIRADLSDDKDRESSFEAALKLFNGTVDILVNSAGIQRRASSEDFTRADWNEVLNINLNATFFMSQIAGRNMLERGRGKIINIASVMSFFGGVTIPAYAASKGAVAQLTRAMSNDWASRGVCVNAIAPGYMETALNTALLRDEIRTREILNRVPMGRWGSGDDIKGMAVFLASEASNFVSGAIIPLDGGYSSR